MFAHYLANKLLIFVKSCFCYLLYNRYIFSYILLELKVKYNFKTFVRISSVYA